MKVRTRTPPIVCRAAIFPCLLVARGPGKSASASPSIFESGKHQFRPTNSKCRGVGFGLKCIVSTCAALVALLSLLFPSSHPLRVSASPDASMGASLICCLGRLTLAQPYGLSLSRHGLAGSKACHMSHLVQSNWAPLGTVLQWSRLHRRRQTRSLKRGRAASLSQSADQFLKRKCDSVIQAAIRNACHRQRGQSVISVHCLLKVFRFGRGSLICVRQGFWCSCCWCGGVVLCLGQMNNPRWR